MADIDLLTALMGTLDEKTIHHARLAAAYEGRTRLTTLAPEIRAQLNNRLDTVSVNVPRLVVDSIADRLRVTGFTDPRVWAWWQTNNMPTYSAIAHREALMLGDCYALVWGTSASTGPLPTATVESSTTMAVQQDHRTHAITAAVKRWEADSGTYAMLYLPDVIRRYHHPSRGAYASLTLVGSVDNPLGTPPVARLRNGDRLVQHGISEMADVLPLSDALTKLVTDLLVASEYAARPRRWATGIELEEDADGNALNPIPESNRAMTAENPDAKFGQLPGSDLAGYQNAIRTVLSLISAITGLPEHALGIGTDNPTSADAMRASEAALTARAEARQRNYGLAWNRVAQLMVAIATGTDPSSVDVQTQWADASTRSTAQEADALVKLVQSGILPPAYALKKLGYDDAEVNAAMKG